MSQMPSATQPAISREKWYKRIGYTPRKSQAMMEQAIADGARYIGYFAFPRAGKSFGAARFLEPLLLRPDFHAWIVAPNYALGSKEFGYIWNDFAETGFLAMASRRNFDIRGGNMRLHFPWGALLEVVSADNPASLRAEELDLLILAEAAEIAPELHERHLFARVEKRKGITIVPTTPKGYNWVHDKFRIPSLKIINGEPNPAYDPLYWSVVVSADPELGDVHEPGIYDDDYLVRAKKMLPYPIYMEQVGGGFASYAGLIYPEPLSRLRVPRFPIPDHWTHVVGWDHGANAPTAILAGSYSPEGVLYWWGEIYTVGFSAKEYYSRVQALLGTKTSKVAAIAIDRSAMQVRIELEQIGVGTTTPDARSIQARIIRTTQLMREDKWKILEGTCPNLEQELVTWEWDDKNPGKPRERQRCHALDATGYASLIPVGLPEDGLDPFSVQGEDSHTSEFWRPFRQRMAKEDELRQAATEASLFDEDLFDEAGLLATVGAEDDA